jgi:hypothetical protein
LHSSSTISRVKSSPQSTPSLPLSLQPWVPRQSLLRQSSRRISQSLGSNAQIQLSKELMYVYLGRAFGLSTWHFRASLHPFVPGGDTDGSGTLLEMGLLPPSQHLLTIGPCSIVATCGYHGRSFRAQHHLRRSRGHQDPIARPEADCEAWQGDFRLPHDDSGGA